MTRELFQAGDRLGDYEILGRLRAGGMATLFLGRRHGAAGVSRPVAIKVIHPHLAEEDLIVRMFIDEARISSHISHGNVVYIENFGEHQGVYYMVMEYVDGCSLEQVLKTLSMRGHRIAPEVAVHVALEAAAGLHAAHETAGDDGAPLGIVHRDVSPSNILLTRDGRVKVIDFGIAKARGRLGATSTGNKLKGKLRYMSPEQAWGRAIDRRTDVYALGLVLWELLAVRPLFRADDELALLELVRNPTIPPPSEHHADVTLALDAVIARATAKDAAHRLPTALELRRELMQAVPGAVTVPAEALAELVAMVSDTLGVAEIEDRKATTPARKLSSGAPVGVEDAYTTQLSPAEISESAVRSAAGEVQPRPRRRARAWTIAGGVAAAGAIAAAIAIGVDGGGGGRGRAPSVPAAAAPAPAPSAAPEPAPPAPPPEAEPAKPAPPPTTAKPAPTTAKPAPPPAKAAAAPRPAKAPAPARPRARATQPPAAPAGVQAVDVDGEVLAVEPASKPAPKPTPKKSQPRDAVRVDDAVLAR
jgi:serine/threonine-protein kinase